MSKLIGKVTSKRHCFHYLRNWEAIPHQLAGKWREIPLILVLPNYTHTGEVDRKVSTDLGKVSREIYPGTLVGTGDAMGLLCHVFCIISPPPQSFAQ